MVRIIAASLALAFASPAWAGESITIYVKTLDGDRHSIEVDNEASVATLKTKVSKKTGIAVPSQRLVHGGKPLTDDRTLIDYDIEAGATLTVVRKRG